MNNILFTTDSYEGDVIDRMHECVLNYVGINGDDNLERTKCYDKESDSFNNDLERLTFRGLDDARRISIPRGAIVVSPYFDADGFMGCCDIYNFGVMRPYYDAEGKKHFRPDYSRRRAVHMASSDFAKYTA